MRHKVLLHSAVLLELIGLVKIVGQRAVTRFPDGGVFAIRNAPLALIVLTSVILLEASNRKLTGLLVPMVIVSSMIFAACSFYLPPEGHSYKLAIVFAYLTILALFSTSLVITFAPSPSAAKVISVTTAIAVAAFIAGFINTFSRNDRFAGKTEADVAVVLGCGLWGPHTPSPDLKARLDAAAELYRNGEAKKIAVTGGLTGFHTYESAVGARYLESIGIPESDIITEDKTENTIEQVLYVKRYLMGKLKMKHVVIVSDGWHLPRALLMCEWSDVRATGYASYCKMPLEREMFWRLRESAGLQAYMLFGA